MEASTLTACARARPAPVATTTKPAKRRLMISNPPHPCPARDRHLPAPEEGQPRHHVLADRRAGGGVVVAHPLDVGADADRPLHVELEAGQVELEGGGVAEGPEGDAVGAGQADVRPAALALHRV